MADIQEIFNTFYDHYKNIHNPCGIQQKVVWDIMNCRTTSMGGRIEECSICGHSSILFNSCRNRNCPLCQNIPKEKWIDARKSQLLSAPYFHVVFTVPDELKMLIYHNQKLLYNLMYKVVSKTLLQLAGSKKHLNAQIGFTAVLHTWGKGLIFHPHLHVIVLAGGLTKEQKWKCTSKKFFIPIKKLSKKFRGKFLFYLKKYYKENKLEFYGMLKEYENPDLFQELVDICFSKSWYTYSRPTFSGPEAVIRYLGRYTHRVAISNSNIISVDENTVTIKVKDYKKNGAEKLLTLDGVEFIRRFLMHVLPKGFVKLRHFGILANVNKKTKLELCRKLTNSLLIRPVFKNLSVVEIVKILTGKDITKCPVCNKGKMKTRVGWNRMCLAPT